MLIFVIMFFFVKQKTAYESRISDWSSDVCSSDLYRKFDYPAMVERIRSEVPALEHVIVHGVGAGGFESWTSSGRVPEHREFAGRRLDPRGVGRVAFTSGTTAKPKGVMHGHNTDMTPPTWEIGRAHV